MPQRVPSPWPRAAQALPHTHNGRAFAIDGRWQTQINRIFKMKSVNYCQKTRHCFASRSNGMADREIVWGGRDGWRRRA